jgi:hypothetical protein
MINNSITLPESKLNVESSKVESWIQDPTLRRVLAIAYLIYEFYRLVLTSVATILVFVVQLYIFSIIPLGELNFLIPDSMNAGGITTGYLHIAISSALFVIIADLFLSRSHRSIISYVCIIFVGKTLNIIFTFYSHISTDSDLDPEILDIFAQELVKVDSFQSLIIKSVLKENKDMKIKFRI